jgi:uncharacterized protein
MDFVYYLLLVAMLLVGWLVNLFGLPGLWVMLIAQVAYAFATGWGTFVGWPSVVAMLALALAAEGVEFFAGAAGSASAGGRKRGMVGAIVGGFIGAMLGTPIFPIVGTILGACAGAFVGAAVFELTDKDSAHAIRVGIGAAKGRFWAILSKLAFGLIMFIVGAWAAFPQGASIESDSDSDRDLLPPISTAVE